MKTRSIITLGIVVLIVGMVWLFTTFTGLTTVPSDEFADAVRKHSTINSLMTRAPESLPLGLRIRFPKQESKGSTGMMDRSDVYILSSRAGEIECTAHIRGDRVCLVTFNKRTGAETIKTTIQNLFPGLSVD